MAKMVLRCSAFLMELPHYPDTTIVTRSFTLLVQLINPLSSSSSGWRGLSPRRPLQAPCPSFPRPLVNHPYQADNILSPLRLIFDASLAVFARHGPGRFLRSGRKSEAIVYCPMVQVAGSRPSIESERDGVPLPPPRAADLFGGSNYTHHLQTWWVSN